MQRAVANDRRWFERHPEAVVRFRRARAGEFHPVLAMGERPACFIPQGIKPSTPLSWVAVVDLNRAQGYTSAQPEGSIRARIRTAPIRTKQWQQQVKAELIKAISQEIATLTLNDQPPSKTERAA
jgi:hypothetical protein